MSDRWQRLSQHLDDLFDLDPAAREARLEQIGSDDAALAAELRRLVAVDQRSGVLDHGVVRAAPTAMSELAGVNDELVHAVAGKRLGPWRLVERIGRGGMGEVWRGERVDDFEQQVAIKLIRPLLDSPQLRERFSRERRILARLDHPNIARLLDGGIAEDGTPWYAMEFVRGMHLLRYAVQSQLDTRARIELLLQVCDAVAHAHSLLVVHRDLKPANILVDAQGRARVLDFGIARLLDDTADERLTGTGMQVFSTAYAAPEQIRGEPVGTAADVFALGAVLYELLTEEVPHPRRSGARERLLTGLASETAPLPSRALRERASTGERSRTLRDVVGDLDTIVATALQPEAARRYVGAAQLADDLRRWLDGRPIAAQPDSGSYRLRKFVARHRFAVGSASAVLLALVAGLGLALWQASVARDQARRADTEAQRANAEAARAEREAAQALALTARVRKVKEFFLSGFIQADPIRREREAPVTVKEAFDALLERARTELADDPVLQADVFDDFGEVRVNQGRFDEAKPLLEQALAVAEREFGPTHPVVAETLQNQGVVAFYEGRQPEAIALIERAVAILEADDGGDPLALANVLNSQASLLGSLGHTERAITVTTRALELYRAEDPEHANVIGTVVNLATLHSNAGRLDESDALLKEAVASTLKRHGEQSAALVPVYTTLAATAFMRGDPKAEADYTERALSAARANFPDAHPWTASALVERGAQIARAGDAPRGEALIREGVEMYDELESAEVVTALRRLAIAQRSNHDDPGALASLQRAHARCVEHDSPEGPLCMTIRANRASMLARTGKADEALREADIALAALRSDASRYSEQGQAMEARAAAFEAMGRKDEARAELDAVIALLSKNFGPTHSETRRAQRARDRLD
jgi:eukaryotic-like serine/threonine-protein kinase